MTSSLQSSLISDYAQLKSGLLACIEDLLAIENIRSSSCEELRDKIRANTFNLVVVGQFKRGKTSLINALIGNEILPVSVVPLTSIVTIMTYGDALRVKVYFNDDRTAEIKPESIPEYVTENSIYQHNTDIAYQYLPKSDAALFLLSVDQPMSKAEIDFLHDVKEYSNKIMFLLIFAVPF